MTAPTILPYSIRDVTPGPDYVLINPQDRAASHTGGAYLHPATNHVWKALDCRPHVFADPVDNCHVPTREAECLAALAGLPGFPRNWHLATQNGRRWLVRPRLPCIPADFPLGAEHLPLVLRLEAGIRAANMRGWEVIDPYHLEVAYDPDAGELIVLDLSTALLRDPRATGIFRADDEDRFLRWLPGVGLGDLADLRRTARRLAHDPAWFFTPGRRAYRYVYAAVLGHPALPPPGALSQPARTGDAVSTGTSTITPSTTRNATPPASLGPGARSPTPIRKDTCHERPPTTRTAHRQNLRHLSRTPHRSVAPLTPAPPHPPPAVPAP